MQLVTTVSISDRRSRPMSRQSGPPEFWDVSQDAASHSLGWCIDSGLYRFSEVHHVDFSLSDPVD